MPLGHRVAGSFVVTVNLTTAARFTVFPVEGGAWLALRTVSCRCVNVLEMILL